MFRIIGLYGFVCICLFFSCSNDKVKDVNAGPESSNQIAKMKYPHTMRSEVIEDYHGTKVPDPYRWLEDDRSKETEEWVIEQNTLTSNFLSGIGSRKKIKERLQDLWSYERFSAPIKKKELYYFFKNNGLQNQDILYKQKGLDGEASVVLDPNEFSTDGTASLGGISFSKDGKYLAYQVSKGGSDWHSIRILNLKTGENLADQLEWIKFSAISWAKDGFYYSRYPKPSGESALTGENQNQTVYYHEVNSSQAEDKPIYFDRAHPDRGFTTSITEDQKYLTISAWESTSGTALYFKNLDSKKEEFVPIVENFENDYTVIDHIDGELLVLTNFEAANKKIISINTSKYDKANWRDIIPESDDVLQDVNIYGNKLVCQYIKDASSQIKIYDLNGKLSHEVKLPSIGTVQSIRGTKEDSEAFFSFASFTKPSSTFSLDIKTADVKLYREPKINFDSEKYVTKQIWYPSKDGMKIPMFITHKKDLVLDGKRPTLIYGYGGFDISILPGFNTTRLALAPIILENDGVFAVANIRGGGEFGKDWHQSGTKERKQNVFNDFIAGAEYLIANKYTSNKKLAAYGRSNGGLLIGACMTQRPDLFQVALPAVGVLDMLRYEKFTIGWAWATDYGSSAKPEDFKYLYAYSPLHNMEKKEYPATLVTTADHDDRVVPAHSFKFISELQYNQTGAAPVLIRVATSAGHGAGKSTEEKINEASDVLSFMYHNFEENLLK